MARNENVRLQARILQADADAYLACQAIVGYHPANPAYSLAAATASHESMRAAREAERHAQNALAAARDAAVAAQWKHHNLILGIKDQIIAQFGADSDEAASLGRKKKSERKAPTRTARTST